MNFDLSDDQKMLAEQARKMLEEMSPPDRLRAIIEAKSGFDPELWSALGELGFLGAAIPEEFGGLSLSLLELAVLAEEMGRSNAAVPFFSSIVLAARAIELAGTQAQKETWLPRLASGETIATFAYGEGPGNITPARVRCEFANGALTGTKSPVSDLAIADIAVVLCRTATGPALALVELDQDGVSRQALTSFDELRLHGALTLNNAKAALLDQGDAAAIFDQLLNAAAVITAFEQVGGTEACLYMARDYAMERQIFGRQLASYQAIKHRLANLYVKLELARSNAMYAAWTLVNDRPDQAQAVAAARISALEAFEFGARENLQIHGGIGYTFEANCHFYYRRERLLAAALGNRTHWADRAISALSA
jgi:acyl-CoA dehydrogenase